MSGFPMSRRQFGITTLAAGAATALGFATAKSARAADAPITRYHVPAEWEPHAGCLMAFPWDASDNWGTNLAAGQREVAAIANAIAKYEPVVMAANPGTEDAARALVGPGVTVFSYPINDCWARDNGPIMTVNARRTAMVGLDFDFNGWGGKFPFALDQYLPEGLAQEIGIQLHDVSMVLEGGSVIQDGQGTLIATEECLLNPNRNPNMTKAQIESTLLTAFGASKFIWIPYGLFADTITNGHIDLLCAFVGPGQLLFHMPTDPNSPNYPRMQENLQVLSSATDAQGRSFQITTMPYQPWFNYPTNTGQGTNLVRTFSYTNYYRTAGNVVVPLANVPDADAGALAVLRSVFPDKQVVGVPAPTLAWNGGGVHCITQQIPQVGVVVP